MASTFTYTGGNIAVSAGTTGTGLAVAQTSPTLVTPILGVASATSLSFSSTSGIIGTTTNNSAAAGSVGEVVSSVIPAASAVSLTSAAVNNITSIALTAGDWDIWGNMTIKNNQGVTVFAYLIGWISTSPSGLPDGSLYNYTPISGTQIGNPGLIAPGFTVSIASPTTYYLSCFPGFSVSTASGCGGVYARRRR